eukprot:gb/GECH01014081.1/.p1 GENE.gb/GECH01014081.1/~~gb/GECH01014081.1/.p1  ORF type:complete len:694 (+),score=178.38 gb/GECH01014081.1/:1-2082(+)
MGNQHSIQSVNITSKPSFSEESFRHPPQDLINHSAVFDHRGRLWVYGGKRAMAEKDAVVDVYNEELRYFDIATQEWRVVFFQGESPGIRMGHHLFAQPIKNQIHLFAGLNEDGEPQADIYSLSLETLLAWKEKGAKFDIEKSNSDTVGFIDVDRARFDILYEPFNMISMCSVIFDDVQMIHPRGEMPEFPLRSDAMVISGRKAFFFGEENDMVKVYELHLDKFIWRKVTTYGDKPKCFGHYTATAFGNRVILFGALDHVEPSKKHKWSFGIHSSKKHCHCFFFDIDSMQWSKINKSFTWRQGHSASLYDGELYIFGGIPNHPKETLMKINFTDDAFLEDPNCVHVEGPSFGTGSFGHVYPGTLDESASSSSFGSDPHHRRAGMDNIVVKRLKNQECIDEESMKRELEEYMKVHKAMNHPHVVSFIKGCLKPDNAFLVYEKANKGNLCRLMRARQKFFFADIVEFALSISDAIGYLHNTVPPVVHGHLSCENVLVFSGNHLKVSDFGLDKVRKANVDGQYVENPQFLAPEVLASIQDGEDKRTTASDVYSLGMLMWVMLTRNTHPFGRDQEYRRGSITDSEMSDEEELVSFPEVMERVLDNNERPEIKDIKKLPCYDERAEPDLRDFIHIMEKCWQEDPADRPKAGEVSFAFKWIMREVEDNRFHVDVWGPVKHGELADNPQVWNMHKKEENKE